MLVINDLERDKILSIKKATKRLVYLIPQERIENKIFLFRENKVMIDRDLAELYGVETKALNLAVKRNIDRFPEDFMFQLTEDEDSVLRFQIETSKKGRGGRRYLPYVFTQEGVAMLSQCTEQQTFR